MNDLITDNNKNGVSVLYGAEISYYTGKVRAYLRWKGVPFTEVPAGREVYRDIIIPRIGYPIIPVVVTPDEVTLQDSTDIIDHFERENPDVSVYPATPTQKLVSLLMEVYGDEWLVLPAMHYRWNRNEQWVLREFGRLSKPDASEQEQLLAGEKVAGPFKGSLPFLGITALTEHAIEKSYESLLAELNTHFKKHDFLLGSRPCVGDFGLMGPLYAHLFRDPESGKLMRSLAPDVAAWVERMQSPEPLAGEYLPNDEVPDTLIPVLTRMWREQMPVLADTAVLFADWQEKNEGQDIPRAIGQHQFNLEDVSEKRIVMPFSLWMLQRPLDHLISLNSSDRASVDELLDQLEDRFLRSFPRFPRLIRKNFKLVAENL